jgi:hypothetical protein
MLRDVVTEQEPKGVPIAIAVVDLEPKVPRKRGPVARVTARREDDPLIPSKRIKSMYRRANAGIPLRQWAALLQGEDRSVVEQWWRNKRG